MNQPRPDIAELARMKRRPRRRWWVAGLVLALAGGAALWLDRGDDGAPAIRYDTAEVTRGDLLVTVIATGTVQPTVRVDISSELSGTIAAVEADFNESVREGQVLARLDDTRLRAQVANAGAQLASARARLDSARATATETAEALGSAEALDRRGLATRPVTVSARAAHDRALAAVAMAEADVTLAEANLDAQRLDLEKTAIRAPIDGIVLDRTVEKGQIVAATLNAPVLFTLAGDLSRMELRVGIDEADIGRVRVGQEADFTVDAWPGRSFAATITQIRYAPDATQGVVTYTAVLSVENPELALRPGMTATATITVSREADRLLVPLAALRYAPAEAGGGSRGGGGLLGLIMPAAPRPASGVVDGTSIWLLREGRPQRVRVTPGASDGSRIAITTDEVRQGDRVILSQRGGGG